MSQYQDKKAQSLLFSACSHRIALEFVFELTVIEILVGIFSLNALGTLSALIF